MFFAHSNIDRQDFCWKILIPHYQSSFSCFLIDIGPILPKSHLCFLVDIGPISKISENFWNESSSFFGARFFNMFKNCEIQPSEIYDSDMFQKCFLDFFRCLKMSWYIQTHK